MLVVSSILWSTVLNYFTPYYVRTESILASLTDIRFVNDSVFLQQTVYTMKTLLTEP